MTHEVHAYLATAHGFESGQFEIYHVNKKIETEEEKRRAFCLENQDHLRCKGIEKRKSIKQKGNKLENNDRNNKKRDKELKH